jgi:hypothetical protein
LDITQLILDDHNEQRRLFAILEQINPADSRSLSVVWKRLSTFLEVHAETEERVFYPALLRVGRAVGEEVGVEDETLDAIKDHNEIRDALAAVRVHQIGSEGWYAAVAAANKANSEHLAEEEREGLTDFRRQASLQLRHDLAVAFAGYEIAHHSGVQAVDKDPVEYVQQRG